jgi:hypothetical protein
MSSGLPKAAKTAVIVGFWHEIWVNFKSLATRKTGYAQMVQQ